MKIWIARIVIGLFLLIVVAAALNWRIVHQIITFHPIILPYIGPSPETEAEARLQDIEYLSRLLKYDRSFDEDERSRFEAMMETGRQAAGAMSAAEFYLFTAEATALADNGHTRQSFNYLPQHFAGVEVRFFDFSDGVYIVRAAGELEALIGRRVTAVDGRPVEEVLESLRIYVGDMDSWRRIWAVLLLEYPEILYAAGLADAPEGYTVSLVDASGNEQQVYLAGQPDQVSADAILRSPLSTLHAEELRGEGASWAWSLGDRTEENLPLYLQAPDTLYRWVAMPDGGGYLRLNAMGIPKPQTMVEFFAAEIEPLADGSLEYLVVDLRTIDGGNSSLFAPISKWLPDKVADGGKLYILVGPQTFSAGLNGVALLKFYGGEKSVIVGAPMGSRAQYWAERGTDFRLPNSGMIIRYATAYHDWANGCEDHPYCFTQTLIHGVAAGSLAPMVEVGMDYTDYAAGIDPVMDWVFEQG